MDNKNKTFNPSILLILVLLLFLLYLFYELLKFLYKKIKNCYS